MYRDVYVYTRLSEKANSDTFFYSLFLDTDFAVLQRFIVDVFAVDVQPYLSYVWQVATNSISVVWKLLVS